MSNGRIGYWKLDIRYWILKMLETIKNKLYFPLAWYFRFFAEIRLRRWKPRIVVVTGSSGKTTLLHLLESQFGIHAKFSHHANSSYGIPFDILNLHRKSLKSSEWIHLFLKAPLQAFKEPFKEQYYIVEADTDRPGEGRFLAEMLQPEVVLWVSVSATHGMNFDKLVIPGVATSTIGSPQKGSIASSTPVKQASSLRPAQNDKKFNSVEEAIAYDFGYFLEYCSKMAVIDGDSKIQTKQVNRTKAKVRAVQKRDYLESYKVERYGTEFEIEGKKYLFSALLPREVFYSIKMCRDVVEYFNLPFDKSFSNFVIPEGRGSLFRGVKDTALIDSTYNANLSSVEAMLGMYAKFPAEKKWVVLGDMLELGEKEQEEHERLGEILGKMELERIILVGKRVSKYTLPSLRGKMTNPAQRGALPTVARNDDKVVAFEKQSEALDYLEENIEGGEAILFKGSQSIFLEGIIEALLANKEDASKLPRRGIFWMNKRRDLGL